jgi:hypothetical protein
MGITELIKSFIEKDSDSYALDSFLNDCDISAVVKEKKSIPYVPPFNQNAM